MSWPYDYIIIGAGSAGSAIANRLAEDFRLRILILEAGPADDSFLLKMPAGFASLGDKSPYNWRYETTPQTHCNNRRMYWPRGKTLGGSSAINAMLYVRGNAWDYDHWRQLGNEAGATTTCCRSSRRRRTTSAAATRFTAPAVRSTSPTRPIRCRSTMRSSRPANRPATSAWPTSTARPRRSE